MDIFYLITLCQRVLHFRSFRENSVEIGSLQSCNLAIMVSLLLMSYNQNAVRMWP
jgi:hypothetical protein